MTLKKIKNFFNKERERLLVNPNKQGAIVAVYLYFFISIPILFIVNEKRVLMLTVNFIYAVISYFSILLSDLVFNKIIFKKRWNYKTEFSSVSIMFFYSYYFIYQIDKLVIQYFNGTLYTNPRSIYKLFLVAVIYTLICYGTLKVYQLIHKKKSSNEESEKYISVNYKGSLYKLNSNEVLLIEAYGNYIKIYLNKVSSNNNSVPIVVRQTLKNIESVINKSDITNLIRCQRSYIVNINFVESIRKSDDKKCIIAVKNVEIKVPISKSKIKYFKDLLIDKTTVLIT